MLAPAAASNERTPMSPPTSVTLQSGGKVSFRVVRDDEWDQVQTVVNAAFDTFIHGKTGVSTLQHRYYLHRAAYCDVAVLAEAEDGSIAGVVFANMWGKCGWFGPLAVHPSLWGQGLARPLLQHVFAAFEAAGAQHVDLFTFTNSLKHHHLYSSFGCQPALLTYLMQYPLQASSEAAGTAGTAGGTSSAAGGAQGQQAAPADIPELPDEQFTFTPYSAVPASQQGAVLAGCKAVTAAMHPGLDCTKEVVAVADHGLGDTLLVQSAAGEVQAFVVVHHGDRTEAPQGVGFVKVAAAGSKDALRAALLYALQFCQQRGMAAVHAGVNLSRAQAYDVMKQLGLRPFHAGLGMQSPAAVVGGECATYNKPDALLLCDLR